MEEEINLREYINLLIRGWYWIAGLALAAAVVAFVVSSLLPPTYEATAMVIVTQPRYLFQFDPRMETVPFDPTQLSKGYPAIATSDDILVSTASAADPPLPPARQSLDKLRQVFTAGTVGDPNLIRLTVQSPDPQEAASLANTWAGQFVEHLNDVYGGNNDLPLFEAQVVEAKTALEQADGALAAFRREYGLGFSSGGAVGIERQADQQTITIAEVMDFGLARRLQAKTELLIQYEARANHITSLLQEARLAVAQADSATSPAIVTGLLGDMLQLSVLDGRDNSLVQINLGELDARASLLAIITALEAKQSSITETIAGLTAEVEALQGELADRQQELDQLLRDRQVAQGTYLTLANKLQEARIEEQNKTGNVAQLLSRAAVPEEPVSPRRLLNTLVAGVLGLMVGVFGAFFLEYWRQGTPQVATAEGLPAEQTSARP